MISITDSQKSLPQEKHTQPFNNDQQIINLNNVSCSANFQDYEQDYQQYKDPGHPHPLRVSNSNLSLFSFVLDKSPYTAPGSKPLHCYAYPPVNNQSNDA